jgi:hypothetical protein
MNRAFIGRWKRLMPEGENGMFTSVAEEFTCQNAASAASKRSGHDAPPMLVGPFPARGADVSHLKRANVASNSCRPECRAKDASQANYVVAAVRKSTAEIKNNKAVSAVKATERK